MRRHIALAALVVIGVTLEAAGVRLAEAQARPPRVTEIQKIKDNLYLITGGGANAAALVTNDGVILVDTKRPGWGQALMDKIKTVSSGEVYEIINTHAHLDNVGANPFFGTFVSMILHENTRANMAKLEIAFWPAKQTFKDRLTLGTGKDEIDLYHFGPGHTNGDTWVVFKQLQVAHAGGMVPGKMTPSVDVANGGDGLAFSKSLAAAAAALTDVDTVITGHGGLMTAAEFKEYVAFVSEFTAWVQSQQKAGKSVDQAAAEYAIPAKYAGYTIGTEAGGLKATIQSIYGGATASRSAVNR